jgi:hypothetical protein
VSAKGDQEIQGVPGVEKEHQHASSQLAVTPRTSLRYRYAYASILPGEMAPSRIPLPKNAVKDQDRYAEAERLYREALAIFELSTDSPVHAANSLQGLGQVFRGFEQPIADINPHYS